MTKSEFMKLASAIKTYFPRFETLPNAEALELWFNELKDLPYQIAVTALRKYVNTPGNRFPPTIADFREMAAQMIDNDLVPDWAAGWAQVMRAIGTYGMWNPDAAIESMDAITRECVKRLGWKELCMSENPTADRANFRMIYEQVQRKKVEAAALPAGLKKDMLQLGEKMKLIGGQDETI